MENNSEKENKEQSKLDKLKEMWKDKRGRAKIKLSLYLIFFVGVIIFIRIGNISNKSKKIINEQNFVYNINDNYEFDTKINIDSNNYHYYGKVLGNISNITKEENDNISNYKLMDDNYYYLDENNNYILTTKDEVYNYIKYSYLDISMIKKLISVGQKEDNIYKISISNIILNADSNEYITLTLDENENIVVIDYTNLFNYENNNYEKVLVTIEYKNINKLTSLAE